MVEYLEAIAEGFRSGKLTLAGGEEEIVLEPSGLVRFEVRASARDDRARFSLRFTWKPKRSEDPLDDKLRITSK